MKKKDGVTLKQGGARLCSTVLEHRVVFHKTTTQETQKITPTTDLLENPVIHSVLYKAQQKLDAALFEAIKSSNIPQMAQLVTQGADCNALRDGLSPLHLGIMQKDVHVITALITHGADVDIKGAFGNTPLHESALNTEKVKVKIAEILIIAGANVNAQNDFGQTPLHFHQHSEYDVYMPLAKALITAGARLHLKDIKGNEPLDRLPAKLKDHLIVFALYAQSNRKK